MKTTGKRGGVVKTLVGLGILAAGSAGFIALADQGHEADRAELNKLKAAYEKAVSQDKLSDLWPMVDKDFSGTLVTGKHVASTKEWEQYWGQLKAATGIGKGAKYEVKVEPFKMGTMFVSDVAVSFGQTTDVFTPAPKKDAEAKAITFHSNWIAVSKKVGGSWKLAAFHDLLNPESFTEEQKKAFQELTAKLEAGEKK